MKKSLESPAFWRRVFGPAERAFLRPGPRRGAPPARRRILPRRRPFKGGGQGPGGLCPGRDPDPARGGGRAPTCFREAPRPGRRSAALRCGFRLPTRGPCPGLCGGRDFGRQPNITCAVRAGWRGRRFLRHPKGAGCEREQKASKHGTSPRPRLSGLNFAHTTLASKTCAFVRRKLWRVELHGSS